MISTAAKLRSAIETITAKASEPVLTLDYITHPDVVNLQVTDQTVYNTVSNMYKSGYLSRIRIFRKDAPNCKFAYTTPGKDPIQHISKPVEKEPEKVPEEVDELKDVKLFLMKETGCLRVEFNGLRIEIGVIGK